MRGEWRGQEGKEMPLYTATAEYGQKDETSSRSKGCPKLLNDDSIFFTFYIFFFSFSSFSSRGRWNEKPRKTIATNSALYCTSNIKYKAANLRWITCWEISSRCKQKHQMYWFPTKPFTANYKCWNVILRSSCNNIIWMIQIRSQHIKIRIQPINRNMLTE